jgi:hypothetical protein
MAFRPIIRDGVCEDIASTIECCGGDGSWSGIEGYINEVECCAANLARIIYFLDGYGRPCPKSG